MNRKEIIEHKLRALNPHLLEVKDVSDDHIGHLGNLRGEGQTHFDISISAKALSHLTKIEQHRTINNILKEEFTSGLHALSINIINI